MITARVFKSGNSQAVRLPHQFRFNTGEVEVFRRGDEIVLREKSGGIGRAFDLLTMLPAEAFSEPREDAPPQKRRKL